MKEVYFDTNVYDLLDERLQSKIFGPVNKLKKAIRSDQVRVYTNVIPIQETLGALRQKPAEGKRRLRLIRNLARRKRMIRPHTEIITNDIRSYAKGERFQSQFTFSDPGLKKVFQVRDSAWSNRSSGRKQKPQLGISE